MGDRAGGLSNVAFRLFLFILGEMSALCVPVLRYPWATKRFKCHIKCTFMQGGRGELEAWYSGAEHWGEHYDRYANDLNLSINCTIRLCFFRRFAPLCTVSHMLRICNVKSSLLPASSASVQGYQHQLDGSEQLRLSLPLLRSSKSKSHADKLALK